VLSEGELAEFEWAARQSTTFPWVRGYLLALVAEVRRLRAENDALRQQAGAQQAAANADRATAVELLGRRAEKPPPAC
jgi:hypothetical protein